MDMTGEYNTPLAQGQLPAYQAWAQAGGKDPAQEAYDYDLQGYYKATDGAPLTAGHLTDQFKKPNHPTFSDQSMYHGTDGHSGGSWTQLPNGSYTFTPGASNLAIHGPTDLKSYFDQYEPGNQLIIPGQ